MNLRKRKWKFQDLATFWNHKHTEIQSLMSRKLYQQNDAWKKKQGDAKNKRMKYAVESLKWGSSATCLEERRDKERIKKQKYKATKKVQNTPFKLQEGIGWVSDQRSKHGYLFKKSTESF